MLIQKELEAKIIAALRTAMSSAGIVEPTISGAWATANAGLVKWVDADTTGDACLSVSVGVPSWQTFSTPVVDFAANITLFVRPELDQQGTRLNALAEIVENLLDGWVRANYQQTFTALDLTTLSVDGISLGGGSSPTLQNNLCAVTWNFTLSGSYIAVTESSTNS